MAHQTSNIIDVESNQPYVIYSKTNQRQQNEDSFQIFALTPVLGQKPIIILAIADGMGGHAYGEHVSQQTLRKLSLSLFEQLTIESSLNRALTEATTITPDELAQVLFRAVEQANAYVRKMVEANKWGKAGSTVIVLAIIDNVAVCVNLGDSPLFHYQASSGITKVTQDHTVADVLLRAGMITPEMARYHEGRSLLEFYVGCPQLPPNPPVYKVSLTAGDLLLLCTDGISGSLLVEEIQSILAGDRHLALRAESLIQAAQNAGETDNQTLILWKVE